MAVTVDATAPAQLAPTLNVAISANGDPLSKRITKTLTESGCLPGADVDDGIDVLISVRPRSDAGVCSELREHCKRYPSASLVLVVKKAGTGDVRRALEAGAHAVVVEDTIESALVPSIGAALAGQVVIPAETRGAGRPKVLTVREKQILGLVVIGMTNAEIASKLFLAESTVKSHLSSAFSKLGVASRSEAAAVILDSQSGVGLGILTIPTN
jgi:DNA-binding NarL/FixJ family response regulator